jgi:anti-sigma factor RsiW
MTFRPRLPWRRQPAGTPPGGLRCVELVELVTEYLEDTLAPDVRARFEVHIDSCDYCGAYLEQMRMTLDVVGHLQPDDLDPEMERELLDAFKSWKTSGDA